MAGKKTILVLTREFPPYILGGMSYHLHNLYSELAKIGYNIKVLSGKPNQAKNRNAPTCPENISVTWVPYGNLRGHHIKYTIGSYISSRMINLDDYDLVISHTPVALDFDHPQIIKVHDLGLHHSNSNNSDIVRRWIGKYYDSLKRKVEKRWINSAETAIFNSKLTKDIWSEYFELPMETVIHYNGVDTDTFYPRNSTTDTDYLLFVGDSERKGLSTVTEFAKETDILIKLVGKTKIREDNIHNIGYIKQEQLAHLYTNAIATIHPAKYEAFGNVVLESLACGTPVVTTEKTGASEILTEECGVVTDDLEEGIKEVIDRQIDARDCVSIAEQYTWMKVAEHTDDIIQEIV